MKIRNLIVVILWLGLLTSQASGGSVFPSSSGGGATQPFACNTNNASCLTQINAAGSSQVGLLSIDSSNIINLGATNGVGNGGITLNCSGGTTCFKLSSGGVLAIQINTSGNSFSLLGGLAIQSTGGAVPTCSASTGTCVTTTGSTNNRGQIHLTGGTAVTSITLTFSASGAFQQAPYCTVGSGTAAVAGLASPTGACGSTAACIFAVSSTTAADINYTCM